MADKNEPPQIPSFKPTKKEEKKGGGPLSNFGKSPSSGVGSNPSSSALKWPNLGKGSPKLKVRGLPGGATLVDRLKNLRKKDMGFIAAGLSVLMMAPVAEHFMMTPEDQKGSLTGGFDQKGPLFPDGTTIYESGTGGFSPGSLIGAGTDVITPLNVRDPAALVMGPGASQKAPATVTPPAPTDDKESNWKDALSQAATRGAKSAVKKAKIPRPNVKMAGALRGLSSLSGSSHGGGPTAKLEPLSAANVPNRARASDSLSRSQATPGYRGAAMRSNASSGAPESMRMAGSRAADAFNKGRGSWGLDTAASANIPDHGGWGGAGGGPGRDSAGKSPGGNNDKGKKTIGESLAFMKQKMEQEKALALKWKIKEWETFGRKKMVEEAVYKSAIENILGKGIMEPMGKMIAGAVDAANPSGTSTGVQCIDGTGAANFLANSPAGVWKCEGNEAVYWPKEAGKGGDKRTCSGGCGYKGTPGAGGVKNDRNQSHNAVTSESNDTVHTGAGIDQEKKETGSAATDLDGLKGNVDQLQREIGEALKGKACTGNEENFCDNMRDLSKHIENWKGGIEDYKTASAELVKSFDAIKASYLAMNDELGGDKTGLRGATFVHDAVNKSLKEIEAKISKGADTGYDKGYFAKDPFPPLTAVNAEWGKARAALDGENGDKKQMEEAAAEVKTVNDQYDISIKAVTDANTALSNGKEKITPFKATGEIAAAIDSLHPGGVGKSRAEVAQMSQLKAYTDNADLVLTEIGKQKTLLDTKKKHASKLNGMIDGRRPKMHKFLTGGPTNLEAKSTPDEVGVAGSAYGEVQEVRHDLYNRTESVNDKNPYAQEVAQAWTDFTEPIDSVAFELTQAEAAAAKKSLVTLQEEKRKELYEKGEGTELLPGVAAFNEKIKEIGKKYISGDLDTSSVGKVKAVKTSLEKHRDENRKITEEFAKKGGK